MGGGDAGDRQSCLGGPCGFKKGSAARGDARGWPPGPKLRRCERAACGGGCRPGGRTSTPKSGGPAAPVRVQVAKAPPIWALSQAPRARAGLRGGRRASPGGAPGHPAPAWVNGNHGLSGAKVGGRPVPVGTTAVSARRQGCISVQVIPRQCGTTHDRRLNGAPSKGRPLPALDDGQNRINAMFFGRSSRSHAGRRSTAGAKVHFLRRPARNDATSSCPHASGGGVTCARAGAREHSRTAVLCFLRSRGATESR